LRCLTPIVWAACAWGQTPAFVEVTASAGIDAAHQSLDEYHITGQAWGDVDGDGCVDLYLTTSQGANAAYRNRCDGSFGPAPWLGDAALAGAASGGASFADYDNDGDLDLMVANLGPNTLLRNDGAAGLHDVSAAAGIGHPGQGESVAWGDFDGDGWVDLLVVNWFDHQQVDAPLNHDVLLRNRGDGSFEDLSAMLDGDVARRPGFAGSFLDFDDDGDLDIYVVNDKRRGNALWRNDGAGCAGWCFTDVATATGARRPASAMGLAIGDYDNDGDLDLAYSGIGEVVLLQSRVAEGEVGFVEVSGVAGLTVAPGTIAWGLTFLDADNDGWLDLFVATGNVDTAHADRLFHNRGDGSFEDQSATSGASQPDESLGVARADFDRDGGLDLLVGNRDGAYRLYRNLAPATTTARWLRVEVEGGGAVDRSGLGTRVTLVDDSGRRQFRTVSSGDSLGAGSEATLHFGLGATRAERLEVRWRDGTRGTRTVPAGAQTLRLIHSTIFADGFESGDTGAWFALRETEH